MTNLSLKLQDIIFVETEAILAKLKKPRNTYINEALEFYNAYQKRQLLAQELAAEAKLAASSSQTVLQEMEQLEDEIA